jgi:hypothetical protein
MQNGLKPSWHRKNAAYLPSKSTFVALDYRTVTTIGGTLRLFSVVSQSSQKGFETVF